MTARKTKVAKAAAPGRIITFYSYKGGTGRSMALANIAWILASNNRRVLVIDWDLEAPGLHRYFHPFLADRELAETPGLIDFFIEFATQARRAHTEGAREEKWYLPYTSLLPFTTSLEWKGFADSATVDFVSAGRQDAAYSIRVTDFNWREFYDQLGGGVFLEAVKQQLRQEYDYILIDSRTGISDTSGICTVQMPDDLVVCFTLNQQSIKGAAAVAASVDRQRRKAHDEPAIRIWPVPCRVEPGEKERLDAARDYAHAAFQRYLGHLTRSDRQMYWREVQVQYQPYFAYEEVLAVFAERRHQTASLLSSYEGLTSRLTSGEVKALVPMLEATRLEGLRSFDSFLANRSQKETSRTSVTVKPRSIFISYQRRDLEYVAPIVDALTQQFGDRVWWDQEVLPGETWQAAIDRVLTEAQIVLICFGKGWGGGFMQELQKVLATKKVVVPVLIGGLNIDQWRDGLPEEFERLHQIHAAEIRPIHYKRDLRPVFAALEKHSNQAQASEPVSAAVDPTDPQKHQWGGEASRNGRQLSATVSQITPDWFRLTLQVQRIKGEALTGEVEFHLHSTFQPQIMRAPVQNNRASLELSAWGAFTVGAVADGGRTTLELDLSQDKRFPKLFRER